MQLLRILRSTTHHPLNADRKFAAVMRFARWQLGSRLLGAPVIMDWVNGSRLIIARGMTGATGNLYCGLLEFEDMAFLLHLLRPSDAFVDIGANVGAYTVLAAAAIGASTISVEPVPATFAHLLNNVSINRVAGRVRCLNIGLAHEKGELRFTMGGDTVNHVLADDEKSDDVARVPVERLDDVLGAEHPILIKMDVEGFETNVVRGGAATFADSSLEAVIMELNGSGARYGFDEAALVKRMEEFGFRPHAYEPFSRTLRPARGPDHDGNGGGGGAGGGAGNTIFIRDAGRVSERVKAAPPFTLGGGRKI